jgi:pimeloyl-ACP methyl ester carboxylesterase
MTMQLKSRPDLTADPRSDSLAGRPRARARRLSQGLPLISDTVNLSRRRLVGETARTMAAVSFGLSPVATALACASRTAAPPVPPRSWSGTFGPLKQIDAGVVRIAYVEAGPAGGPVVLLLHGWPYDIHSFADVAPRLASAGFRVIVPYLRGFGATRFLSSETFRNGQQSAVALDVIALMDALGIRQAVMGGFDWGARTVDILAALWPERCRAIVAVSGYLIINIEANQAPLSPEAEHGWWYQYYFATERGRHGYTANLHAFNKLIWKEASPKWSFDDATFERTATAFDNPDHVAIVIHNYRWRLGLAPGEHRYDDLERRLSQGPNISVPAITIASDFDGAAADGAAYRRKYTGAYAHRVLTGIGHNVPQEAPDAFAKAIVDANGYLR